MIQRTNYNNTQKDQIKKIFKTIRVVIPKDILLEVSEWAEKNRFMTSKASNITGAFSYDNTPYAKEIVNCFSKIVPFMR